MEWVLSFVWRGGQGGVTGPGGMAAWELLRQVTASNTLGLRCYTEKYIMMLQGETGIFPGPGKLEVLELQNDMLAKVLQVPVL